MDSKSDRAPGYVHGRVGRPSVPDAPSFTDLLARKEATKKRTIDRICASSFGIAADASDENFTQYPVVVGVIRRAMLTAFEEAANEVAMSLIEEFVRTSGKAAPSKPQAGTTTDPSPSKPPETHGEPGVETVAPSL